MITSSGDFVFKLELNGFGILSVIHGPYTSVIHGPYGKQARVRPGVDAWHTVADTVQAERAASSFLRVEEDRSRLAHVAESEAPLHISSYS